MGDWSDMKFICRKIIEANKNGDPVKDVIENTPYRESEILDDLAREYLRKQRS